MNLIRTIFLVLTMTVLSPFFFYQPLGLIKFLSKIFRDIIFYIPTRKNYFALTFDDGPNPYSTSKILKILSGYNAKATFFVIGKQVEKYPKVSELTKSKGHQISNHFYDSWPSILLTRKRLETSFLRNENLIRQKGYKFVRPSGAFFNSSLYDLAKKENLRIVLGSAYAMDWLNIPRWYIRWAITNMLKPGVIVTLHDGRKNRQRTVDVLPHILKEAQKKNLKAVTLNKLLESRKRR